MKRLINNILVKLKLKKESPIKKTWKKFRKIISSRTFWTKVIVLFSALALVATSILPFLLS